MLCQGCGRDNRPSRKFCADCGAALTLACGVCGAVNELGERFCGECGGRLGDSASESRGPWPRSAGCAAWRLSSLVHRAERVSSVWAISSAEFARRSRSEPTSVSFSPAET